MCSFINTVGFTGQFEICEVPDDGYKIAVQVQARPLLHLDVVRKRFIKIE